MILSVSRRTDIPACWPEWFMKRLREGFVLVRNPMNHHQVSRIAITPEVVDCIVFWTKNPLPLLPHLPEIREMGYECIIQVTLTGYGRDVEAALPPVEERLDAMRRLVELLGPERVVWRYDPILLSDRYTADWHAENFAHLAQRLCDFTERCVISFLDLYPKIRSRLQSAGIRCCSEADMRTIAGALSRTALPLGIALQTCAEKADLSEFGIPHGACIDGGMISRILGQPLDTRPDGNQRSGCGCVASVDIGEYNTCLNGCVYCYANHSPEAVRRHAAQHKNDSPLLVGTLTEEDRVSERKMKSLRVSGEQLTLL